MTVYINFAKTSNSCDAAFNFLYMSLRYQKLKSFISILNAAQC